ncbi:MAG: ATP phosphoribosyltransferase regulatory subunit, partial [Oscillospiraceae bacterium]|nr:ATP phosphoribosyltransferase regulatory subunit [Oscillospiraceae bacterium]
MDRFPIWRADERGGLQLRELFRRHGYLPYRMSKFEPYDLYVKNKSFLVSENILTFTDTDGRLMALKPDVTLSIVKNAQPPAGGLEKVYYHENVYRTTSAGLGFREIMQTGLECIGDLDLAAMGEVLALAAESLRLLGGGEYLLDLGHMGLVSGLLEQVREASVKELLLEELGRKNAPALEQLCAQAGVERELAERLCRLAQLYGPPARVLPQLEELTVGKQAGAALDELKGLCRILESMGLLDGLRLDFSIANDMRYYNGVIFRGYLPGLASGMLAGGRYD